MDSFTVTPFCLIIDSRENAPFGFSELVADAKENADAIVVRTRRGHLKTGDYSIEGFESVVTVERKSHEDAYATFGGGRQRFVRELERMADMEYAAVVFECDWDTLLCAPDYSRLQPKSVYRSIIAWSQRYGVHFCPMPGRRSAENITFRILQRFHADKEVAATCPKESIGTI
jgi:ERCC4-type nuclease